jgi:RNA polymerase sigma-70 factor (ECF subfamily)
MPLTNELRDDILASVPSLRAFAISLSGNGDRADDLVQETLLRALANIDSFQPGSNLPAWLFTILRNLFRSDYRKRRREVEDADGSYAKTLKTQPAQSAHLEFEEFRAALEKLPQDQREALILVGASGFSYEDAAAICGCAVGTIKSRVNRARSKLSALLYVDGAEDFGPDRDRRQRRISLNLPLLREAQRRSNPDFLSVSDCFAELVIGRALARPVGSQ